MRRVITLVLGFLATAWVVYTLYAVLRFGGAVLLDFDTTSRIMSVRNGDQIYSSFGLTYHGVFGALVVVAEVVVVALSLLAALFATGFRRIAGFVALTAWGCLWLGNAIWLRSHGWDHLSDTAAIAVATIAIVAWAFSQEE